MTVQLLDGATILGFVEDEEAFNKWVGSRFSALDLDRDGFLSYEEMVEELKELRLFDTHFGVTDLETDPDKVAKTYGSLFRQFDHDHNGFVDFQEFKKETKNMMIAMANGLGVLPIFMLLEKDSLLFKAAQREFLLTTN